MLPRVVSNGPQSAVTLSYCRKHTGLTSSQHPKAEECHQAIKRLKAKRLTQGLRTYLTESGYWRV